MMRAPALLLVLALPACYTTSQAEKLRHAETALVFAQTDLERYRLVAEAPIESAAKLQVLGDAVAHRISDARELVRSAREAGE